MPKNNEQLGIPNDDSHKTAPPRDKWFYMCELVYVCVYALCKAASPIKGVNLAMLMSVLSGVSVLLIIVVLVKRRVREQRESMAGVWFLLFFTALVIKDCVIGEL